MHWRIGALSEGSRHVTDAKKRIPNATGKVEEQESLEFLGHDLDSHKGLRTHHVMEKSDPAQHRDGTSQYQSEHI